MYVEFILNHTVLNLYLIACVYIHDIDSCLDAVYFHFHQQAM